MMIDTKTFSERAARIRWLLLDVDGVLTDGRLIYSSEGETLKTFNVRDGLALRLVQRAGLGVGLLSGRRSAPLEQRAAELDLSPIILGSGDKDVDFDTFLASQGMAAEEVAYCGDDLPDLPVLRRAGLSFAPADAAPEVRAAASLVLQQPGGNGAVRELVEQLLKARGDWPRVTADYLPQPS